MDTERYRMLRSLFRKSRSLRSIINHPKNLIGTTSIWNAIPTRLCVPPISGPMCWEQCSSGWLPESEGVVTKMRGPHKHGYQGGKKNIKWWGMIDLALDGCFLRLWGVGSVHLRWSHHSWCTCCSCHWCVFDDFGCIVPCSSESPTNNSRRSNTWKLFAAWSVLPITTWFGAPRRHCANLPYRRQTCHLQLGWLFIPVEAYTTSVTLESCFHSRCCWWGHPRLPGPRKKGAVHTASTQPWFLSSAKDTTHIGRGSTSSWEKPDMFDWKHLKTSHACIDAFPTHAGFVLPNGEFPPKSWAFPTHCACGLCNQEFWGPKICRWRMLGWDRPKRSERPLKGYCKSKTWHMSMIPKDDPKLQLGIKIRWYKFSACLCILVCHDPFL